MNDCVIRNQIYGFDIPNIQVEAGDGLSDATEVTVVIEIAIQTDDVVTFVAKDAGKYGPDVAGMAGDKYAQPAALLGR